MLVRAPKKETGLSPELATAATRWRPRSSAGAAWRGEGAPARGGVGPGVKGVTRGAVEQQEVASRPSLGGGGAAQCRWR